MVWRRRNYVISELRNHGKFSGAVFRRKQKNEKFLAQYAD